ncbi:transposon Tf2-6 polyprotein [Trichonephila inaurata madagascariensis]|uniref:Transposon Tf2-6 polyprotein n=1 Tax=Trichonephila inaurata madagascariensis TaxID=2747483 RepID=A0A8X7CMZ2_9ARAC|nr:transposon Tf2-6 polyprotein [Trichonephila inaurata madagascariensis]
MPAQNTNTGCHPPISCYACGNLGFIKSKCPKCSLKKESASVNVMQMFTCLTPPVALLDIEVYEATDTVCVDTEASQSVGGELMFKFLKNRGQKFSEFHLAMCLADGPQSRSLVQKVTVSITIGGRAFQIDLIFLPLAKGNRTLLGVDFLRTSGIVMDMRNNFWYFGDKPSIRIPFSKNAPLLVDDSPVEINSTSCPTNSIPSEVLLQSNPVDETETKEQKQVEKGGIIGESGKIKYLLEISNAPTRGNTAENSVPDEAKDVDATPETDSSTKSEGNASVIPKNRASGSKDMRIGSGNEPINKDGRYDGKIKNDRYCYNKQSRGNSNCNNSYRGNQRFNRYPKLNEQRFNRFKNRGGYSPERFDVEEHYTEGNYSAEARHDTSPVTDLSPRPRSCIPSNKRNERTNYYDSNRKYDGEKKGNFYHRSNSDTRGRRYGPNFMKSTIIKIKIIKMQEGKIMTVK